MKNLLVFVGLLTAASIGAAQSSTEKVSCQKLVENFCDNLWDAPHFGNMDLKVGKTDFKLRLGSKENDVTYVRYEFLQSLVKNFDALPQDIQDTFNKFGLKKSINSYINRKDIKKLNASDYYSPEFSKGVMSSIEDAMSLVAIMRTKDKVPGYIRLKTNEESSEINQIYYKNLDLAWSELFVAVWNKNPRWQKIRETFTLVQSEYVKLINNSGMSESLKKSSIADVMSVQLKIPGENPTRSNSRNWHSCGIDLNNAVYTPSYHDITVCAGDFNSAEASLTIAHEMGHSFSLSRRVQAHYVNSDYGKTLIDLHERSCEQKHYSCEEWSKFKKNFYSQAEKFPDYVYEDSKFLDSFVQSELLPIPIGVDLNKLSTKLGKTTLRSEINTRSIEDIIKPEEILLNNARVKNFRYLSACLNSQRWPNKINAVLNDSTQFELLFAEEYSCQLEKKTSESEALKLSIEEASKMLQKSWAVWLRVPGRYNPLQEARDEEFAQDIEEDVVDSFASRISATILSKSNNINDRRNTYLANIAPYCDKPSFRQAFPTEASVLFKFTNVSHSMGQDRRNKLMTPEIRSVLECE